MCTCHVPPDHAELLVGELDGDLLDVASRTHDLLHDLDGAGRRRASHVRRHLRRLQLDHLIDGEDEDMNYEISWKPTKPGFSSSFV